MVYVTGDTHGEYARFQSSALRRLTAQDTLIICGDFGFVWDGGKREQAFLRKIGKKPYTVLFLDGQHENFERLEQYPQTDWNGGRVRVLEGKLMQLLRGEIYKIEGKTFFTMGGGESVSPEFRDPSRGDWSKGTPSETELLHGLDRLKAAGNRVDYILTHEPPSKIRSFFEGCGGINGTGLYFSHLEEIVSFDRWFFGCLHTDRSVTRRYTAVFQQVVPVE